MTKSPNPTDIHVGSRIRMRRLMLELSQTELATALGISFQQLQKYEKGTNRVSASRLQQISTFLQAPIPFFFEGLPNYADASNGTRGQYALADFSKVTATSEGLSLIKAFMQITNLTLRHCIVRLVESIAERKL